MSQKVDISQVNLILEDIGAATKTVTQLNGDYPDAKSGQQVHADDELYIKLDGLRWFLVKQGADGISVTGASLSGDDLILSFSSGPDVNVGRVKGNAGNDGISVTGASLSGDDLILSFSSGPDINVGKVKGDDGANATQVIQNFQYDTDTVNGIAVGGDATVTHRFIDITGSHVGSDSGVTLPTDANLKDGAVATVVNKSTKLSFIKPNTGSTLYTAGSIFNPTGAPNEANSLVIRPGECLTLRYNKSGTVWNHVVNEVQTNRSRHPWVVTIANTVSTVAFTAAFDGWAEIRGAILVNSERNDQIEFELRDSVASVIERFHKNIYDNFGSGNNDLDDQHVSFNAHMQLTKGANYSIVATLAGGDVNHAIKPSDEHAVVIEKI